MPKELIARNVEEDFAREGEDPLERREDDLYVGWTKGEAPRFEGSTPIDAVQISVKHTTFLHKDDGSGEVPARAPWSGSQSHRELYSAALTYEQINHLIRTLRKARDQVFGEAA